MTSRATITFEPHAGGSWLSVRHSLPSEAALILSLYGAYELARSLVVGAAPQALAHAHEIVTFERATGLFVEEHVQRAAHGVPGLIGLLGVSYLTLHLAVTASVLVWLHQRRPAAYPLVRTTLLLASALALAGYLLFPTAPPRLAAIGIADTVSGEHVDLNTGLVSALYNPYAAVPSMHIGYALVVAGSLHSFARRHVLRNVVGPLYPLFVLLVVVATGNHFLVDALAGAAVAAIAFAVALLLTRPTGTGRLARLPDRRTTAPEPERLAA